MQRTYRQWVVLAIVISSAISLYTNREREKKNEIERQQWHRMFDEQHEQQLTADPAFGAWNDAREKMVYNRYYEQAGSAHISKNIRAEYAACCVGKIKAMFPNGLSGINDIIKIKAMKIDADCAESIGHNFKLWQPEFAKLLRKKFYAFPEVKLLPEGARAGFVDCLTDKVIAKFPNGVTKEQEKALKDMMAAARQECVITAIEKYTKPRTKEKQRLPDVKDTASAN